MELPTLEIKEAPADNTIVPNGTSNKMLLEGRELTAKDDFASLARLRKEWERYDKARNANIDWSNPRNLEMLELFRKVKEDPNYVITYDQNMDDYVWRDIRKLPKGIKTWNTTFDLFKDMSKYHGLTEDMGYSIWKSLYDGDLGEEESKFSYPGRVNDMMAPLVTSLGRMLAPRGLELYRNDEARSKRDMDFDIGADVLEDILMLAPIGPSGVAKLAKMYPELAKPVIDPITKGVSTGLQQIMAELFGDAYNHVTNSSSKENINMKNYMNEGLVAGGVDAITRGMFPNNYFLRKRLWNSVRDPGARDFLRSNGITGIRTLPNNFVEAAKHGDVTSQSWARENISKLNDVPVTLNQLPEMMGGKNADVPIRRFTNPQTEKTINTIGDARNIALKLEPSLKKDPQRLQSVAEHIYEMENIDDYAINNYLKNFGTGKDGTMRDLTRYAMEQGQNLNSDWSRFLMNNKPVTLSYGDYQSLRHKLAPVETDKSILNKKDKLLSSMLKERRGGDPITLKMFEDVERDYAIRKALTDGMNRGDIGDAVKGSKHTTLQSTIGGLTLKLLEGGAEQIPTVIRTGAKLAPRDGTYLFTDKEQDYPRARQSKFLLLPTTR